MINFIQKFCNWKKYIYNHNGNNQLNAIWIYILFCKLIMDIDYHKLNIGIESCYAIIRSHPSSLLGDIFFLFCYESILCAERKTITT